MSKLIHPRASYCTAGPSRSQAHGRPWFPIPIPQKVLCTWEVCHKYTEGTDSNVMLIQFEDGEEGFLGNFDVADLFHALLALLLLFQEFALT